MKKSVIYFIFMILIMVIGFGIVDAATADLGWSGNDDAIIGSDFYQDIVISNISGAKVVGIGGEISVTNESCLTFDSIENVDVNADNNVRKFSFMSLSGTNLDKTIVRVKFVPGSSDCTTNINILSPTISFTSGPSLKPATISKEIHVKKAANNDATLKSLEVVDRELSPAFDPEEESYTVNIPNDVTSATINAEANDTTGALVAGTGLHENLVFGDNLKSITVTAEDGTTKIYQVNLHRVSNDALLKSLSVGSYTLSPVFNENQFSYTVNIPNNVVATSISASPKYDLATVTGNQSYSGLVIGDNIKTITVTAEDGITTQDYTVNLHRLSNIANASNLSIKNADNNMDLNYTPDFNVNTLTYEVNVGDDISSVDINLSSTDSTVSISGNGIKNLSVGNNSYPIVVTAEDGVTKKTYTVNVKKVSSSFSVTGMTITNTSDNSNISYTPTFNQETLSYSANVGSAVSSVEISFVTSDGVTVTGAGTKTLSIGDNAIPIVITASDGITKKNYTVNIHRKSNVISVSNLKITNVANNANIAYTPAFNKDTTSYSANVAADVNSVNISFVTGDGSTVTGDGNKTLSFGNNTFNVMVTAEDGVTKKTYTINIKKLSNDVTTTGLTIKNATNNQNITYTPTFNKDVLTYEAIVANDVSKININLVKGSNNATVTGNGVKNLVIGDNTFTVVVTAEDGVTKKTYTINVTRSEIITSVEFGHTISDGYIKTVSNVMPDDSDTTVLDLKNQLDNDNSKLEVWTADETTKLGDGDRVATGMIVKLIVKGTLADSKIIVIKGDTNGDSDINIIDASAIVNHFLDRIYLQGAYLVAADINDDGDINIIDASAIVNHFLERIKIVFKP